jgi:exopolysaccharide biosynthesis polyprenyl glycosylphosphotransferase
MIFTDLCVSAASFLAAYFIVERLGDPYSFKSYMRIIYPYIILWAALLFLLKMYESFRTKSISDVVSTVISAALVGIGALGIFLYFLNIGYISRRFIMIAFLLTAMIILLEKMLLMGFFRFVRRRDYNTRNILIAGTGPRAVNFARMIEEHSESGLKILGFVDEDKNRVGTKAGGSTHKVIGTFEDIQNIIHNNIVDEVIFIVPKSSLSKIEDVLLLCETEGINVSVATDYFSMKFAKARQTDLYGFPLITFQRAPDRIWGSFIKRIMDIGISAPALIILSPVFLILSVLVKATSEGPVFFRQERVGVNGRQFTLYKFRTMVKDAEGKLKELLSNNEMNGPVFKLKEDPRLTNIGRFLRKFSLDEFPQLWNVLKGEMSIVGPRPPLPGEVSKYDNWQRRRLTMRPGLTCLWQISGRNKIKDFSEWARLDLEYIDKWSLWLDVSIILRTIPAVVFGIGAK